MTNQPVQDILNLKPDNKQVAAMFNETSKTWFIGSVEFKEEYPMANTMVLTPTAKAPEGYTGYLGNGVIATLVRGGQIVKKDVTVRTRIETWAAFEVMSR